MFVCWGSPIDAFGKFSGLGFGDRAKAELQLEVAGELLNLLGQTFPHLFFEKQAGELTRSLQPLNGRGTTGASHTGVHTKEIGTLAISAWVFQLSRRTMALYPLLWAVNVHRPTNQTVQSSSTLVELYRPRIRIFSR